MADAFPLSDTDILVGKIGKAHGLAGETKLYAYSDEPESLLNYREVVLIDKDGNKSPSLKIEKARIQGKTAVYKLETIDNRNRAEAIQGMGILIDKKDLPAALENEYYWFEFEGLPVVTNDGRKLGHIRSIFSNGAQDILVVSDGQDEYLIPVIPTIIKEHNKDGVVITPPPGLLDLNSDDDERGIHPK